MHRQSQLLLGRLSRCLWDDHGIRLDTKVAVYKAAILTSLLVGSETWVLYSRHVRKLEQFHMRCLWQIAHVRWQDKWPNTEVLQICNISGIETLLIAAQFHWTGHVIRMSNDRLPKIIFYSELMVHDLVAATDRGIKTRSRPTLNDAVLCQRTSKHW